MLRAIAVGAVAVAVWALSRPAAAHVHVMHTNPADSEVVTRPLTRIKLHFNSAVEERFARYEVRRSGRVVAAGALRRADAATLVARLRSRLPRGSYLARFRVMSGDGHPIAGRWTFSVRPRRSR